VRAFAGTLSLLSSFVAASLGAQAPTATAPNLTIPVAAAATPVAPLGVERTVPVATHAMPRGATVTPGDFSIIATIVRPALRTAAAAESGWVTRRPVAAGEPLIEPAVGPPALVVAGQAVTFVSEHAGIRLSIRGTAATGGSLGDQVWVRMDSGRRLRGVVTAPATIRADTTSLR
jgi:flagella basal body P-ring formation protein FlgA